MVLSLNSLNICSWIFISFKLSTLLVGSSKSIMSLFLAANKPLARASLCFLLAKRNSFFHYICFEPVSNLSKTGLSCAIETALSNSCSVAGRFIVILYLKVLLNIFRLLRNQCHMINYSIYSPFK